MRNLAGLAGVVVACLSVQAGQAAGFREFGKWSVACDNALACSAFGVSDKDLAGDRWGLRIDRAPGYEGKITIAFHHKDIATSPSLLIDAKSTPMPAAAEGGLLRLVELLLNAATMSLPGEEKGGEIISLAGLKAALLFMDEQQGRIGAQNAFVAKGTSKAAHAPRAYPIIAAAKVPAGNAADAGAKHAKTVMAHYRRTADRKACDLNLEPTSEDTPTITPLGKGLALVEVVCWRAAYQAGSVFYLQDAAGLRDAPFETLDLKTGTLKTGRLASLTSAEFAEGEITSLHKGRGVGGCGDFQRWRWDGRAFRLVQHSFKNLCDHADAAFTVHRAQVREPDGTLKSAIGEENEEGLF